MDSMYYTAVDEPPTYKGGYDSLSQTIRDHWHRFNRDVNATVWVAIVVEPDGKISNKRIERSSNFPDVDQEALRLVDFLTEWNPAKSHGKPVPCLWYVPIKVVQE